MTPSETGREMMRQLLLSQVELQLEFLDKALNTVIARAEIEEREACAKIADDLEKASFLYEARDKDNIPGSVEFKKNAYNACRLIAKAIRERK